jgi:hypothetical protein
LRPLSTGGQLRRRTRHVSPRDLGPEEP